MAELAKSLMAIRINTRKTRKLKPIAKPDPRSGERIMFTATLISQALPPWMVGLVLPHPAHPSEVDLMCCMHQALVKG
jgi:hypothetical protein